MTFQFNITPTARSLLRALYVLSVVLARQRAGASLADAFHHALQFTGRVVMLTGVTLAIAVATWTFSPIWFQADMGILLAFMFLWNMVGALVLLPALAHASRYNAVSVIIDSNRDKYKLFMARNPEFVRMLSARCL